jgi:hypothetical protein
MTQEEYKVEINQVKSFLLSFNLEILVLEPTIDGS